MLHLGTGTQIGLDAVQVALHTGVVGAFGQLVLHVGLVVLHVREESLAHKGITQYGCHAENHHEDHHAPAMAETEGQDAAEHPVGDAIIEGRPFGSRFHLLALCLEEAVGHEGNVYQGQDPAQQQGNGQHDKEVVDIDASRVGRQEDGQEGEDGDERGTEQRHGGTLARRCQGLHARLPGLEVDEDAIYDDDGIIDQHAHGQDERGQRDALHGAVQRTEHKDGAHDDDDKAGTDDDAALDAHEEHEEHDNDEDGLYEVEGKSAQGIVHTVRLVEDLVAGHAHGKAGSLQLCDAAFHGTPHLGDVGTRRTGYEHADGRLVVIVEGIANGLLDALLHLGNVGHTELVTLMSLDEHPADVLHGAELVIHSDTHTLVTIVIVAGIVGAVLSVQRGKYLSGHHAHAGHLVLEQTYLDDFLLLAVQFHTVNAFHGGSLALQEFGIVAEFPLTQAIARQGIEDAIDIAEVILHTDRHAAGQQTLCIGHLTAETVPALFYIIIAQGAAEFHLHDTHVVVGIALHIIQVTHHADLLLQDIGHFQFHLMGTGTGIDSHHHGHLDFHLGVFQFAHAIYREDTSCHQHRHEEVYQTSVVKGPFS